MFRARTGCPPIYNYGSQELQDRVLPEIMSGRKRVCLAITEPEAGSDVKNLSTEAKLSEDGKYYIVNGVESFFFFFLTFLLRSTDANLNFLSQKGEEVDNEWQ